MPGNTAKVLRSFLFKGYVQYTFTIYLSSKESTFETREKSKYNIGNID